MNINPNVNLTNKKVKKKFVQKLAIQDSNQNVPNANPVYRVLRNVGSSGTYSVKPAFVTDFIPRI